MIRQAIAPVLVALVLAPAAAQADGPTVEALARNCMTCHGEDGISPGSMPTLYGKSADWMTAQLLEFRSGARQSTIMGRVMGAFTDEDIVTLADHLSVPK
jgi:sulfide dehydrogenase cytochrome subunit